MLNVVIGLIGLGIVIFLHELGHLLAAKTVGGERSGALVSERPNTASAGCRSVVTAR